MKTTTVNPAQDSLREELRKIALEAFENDAIDAISLKAALKLSYREDALQPQTMLRNNISEVEFHLNRMKEKIQKAEEIKSQPGAELNDKFIFNHLDEPFDVRPILGLIDMFGIESLISTLDSVMHSYIFYTPSEDFGKSTKSDFSTLREVRNAFMRATNKIEMESWLQSRTDEQKEAAKLEFNHRYFRKAS
ncbi:hypothetical protein [Adhaeribacter radiodurans]|uniref:Uncharacterized protein n=1 Tax=Adhaeribacter radiodurans TaxID=2745197 RepID=A0A7L7LBG1_9BACT|nr:hypothetical protein [Adhaeribacter radiodurans]QMU30160.1 hypothetical protein HUW48_19940 [Adhaeribacter radiodurans]